MWTFAKKDGFQSLLGLTKLVFVYNKKNVGERVRAQDTLGQYADRSADSKNKTARYTEIQNKGCRPNVLYLRSNRCLL